jgi:hypothetical protein
MDKLKASRHLLRRGAIKNIARLTGRNIHTVRLWVNIGEPESTKLTSKEANELRKCIMAHVYLAKSPYDKEVMRISNAEKV